jgi:hypothetical protein
MKKLLLIAAVLSALCGAKAHAQPSPGSQNGCFAVGASISCSVSSTATHTVLFVLWNTEAGISGTPSFTNCGSNTLAVPGQTQSAFGGSSVYIARNVPGGSCQVSATFNSSGGEESYAYLLDINADANFPMLIPEPLYQYGATSWTVTMADPNPNTLAVSCGVIFGSNHTSLVASRGTPLTQILDPTTGIGGIGCFYDQLSAPTALSPAGRYQNTLSGPDIGVFGLMFQSTPAAGGIQQDANCPATSASNTCSFMFPTAANDNLIEHFTFGYNDTPLTMSNSASLTPTHLPNYAYYNESWLYPNEPSESSLSFSVTQGSGVPDITLIEVGTNIASSNPLVSYSAFYDFFDTFGGPGTTTISAGPAQTIQAGSYWVFSAISGAKLNSGSNLPTASVSTLYPVVLNEQGYSESIFAGTVTSATPAITGYNNTFTIPTAKTELSASTYLFSASPFTLVHPTDSFLFFGTSSPVNFTMFNPLSTGQYIFLSMMEAGAAPPSWSAPTATGITFSAVEGCQSGDIFCTYQGQVTANGSPAISLPWSGGGGSFFGSALGLSGGPFNLHTSQTNASASSINTGSISPTAAYNYVIGCGYSMPDLTASWVQQSVFTWPGLQPAYVDDGGQTCNGTFAGPGSINTTFTTGTTQSVAAMIASFGLSISTSYGTVQTGASAVGGATSQQ